MDAECAVVDHLNARGIGATAYYDVPADRPAAFVVVERTGGPRGEGQTSRPMLDLQCWAPTRREASLLASYVEAAMAAMPDEVAAVAHISVTSTFRDRDLKSGTPRFHVVCELYSNE